jgi:CubicO group peptidase (beta-lactamase class C family)
MENKFKKPLEMLLDSLVFRPLEMKDTRYWSKVLDTTRFAHWHDGKGKRYEVSERTGVSAADDLLTTIEDYCKFEIDVMDGAGLSDSLLAEMKRPQVEVRKHYYRGLGWGLITDLSNGEYALEHGGSDIGVRTMAILLPLSKRGIVVMTNGDNGMNVFNHVIKNSMDVGKEVLEYMYQSPTARKAIALPSAIVEEYVGTYIQPNGRIMIVAKQDDALRISGEGIPTLILYPETESKFFVRDFDAELEFIKDETGKVIKLATYENGNKGMEAAKRK